MHKWYKIKRTLKTSRSSSLDSDLPPVCADDWTFGLKSPIIDFFPGSIVTKFAPLKRILDEGPDEIMLEAYALDAAGSIEKTIEPHSYSFRWIHIPANNMEWVETVIKQVCDSIECRRQQEEEERMAQCQDPECSDCPDDEEDFKMSKSLEESTSTGDADSEAVFDDATDIDSAAKANNGSFADSGDTEKEKSGNTSKSKRLKASYFLKPEFWTDQQRGRLENCANNPLYARHMVPFFSEIPTNREAILANKAKCAGMNYCGEEHPPKEKQNAVIYMPYLHWATAGPNLKERSALLTTLDAEFKKQGYKQPTYAQILESEPLANRQKMRLMRSFLYPERDLSLHIRRTLDQFYYGTGHLVQGVDPRTEDQVVYRFAQRQFKNEQEEMAKAEWQKPPKGEKQRQSKWDPPKIIMVNQMWMWVIGGDTVITSFPAKFRSATSTTDRDGDDHVEGDELYDPTDIWMSVFKELRRGTNYGLRSAKSALNLAWTIADQALGVFHKRNLPPHLQFIDMFEMSINAITFQQTNAFDDFSRNVQASHSANSIDKVLQTITRFQKKNFSANEVKKWRKNFQSFAKIFRKRLDSIVTHSALDDSEAKPPISYLSTVASHYTKEDGAAEESGFRSFLTKLFGANVLTEEENWTAHLDTTFENLENIIERRQVLDPTNACLDYRIKATLKCLFEDLEVAIEQAHTTDAMNSRLDEFLQGSLKLLERYTDLVMDDLFDITVETNLVKEIKDIIDELNIISCLGRQQQAVIGPFTRHMFYQLPGMDEKEFHDSTRLENHIVELQKSAKATYSALRDLLDLKQKQASVIEARSARKDAQASSDQAAASTSLAYEAVKQGWSIMLFTIVTIIFLPLSFFTSLFGMNAKELISGDLSMAFYSEIMYPVSFIIICISLGLAFNTNFRYFVLLIFRKILQYTLLTKLSRKRFGLSAAAGSITESIEKEKKRRATSYGYKKWKVGFS